MSTFNRDTVKLGKRPAQHNKKNLSFAKYVANMPAPPATLLRSKCVSDWGMLANDTLGDCTCAGVLHAIQLLSACNGDEFKPTNEMAIQLYEKFGYNPDDPSTDQGADETDVLNYWHKNGVEGHQLKAWATIHPNDLESLRKAIYLFGTVYFGVQLPLSAQSQSAWAVDPNANDPDAAPGSWGGHCVVSSGDYSPASFPVITWGEIMQVQPEFIVKYFDEIHVPLSGDWIDGKGQSPVGFDLAALQADLQALADGPVDQAPAPESAPESEPTENE